MREEKEPRRQGARPPRTCFRIPLWARRWLWRLVIAGMVIELFGRVVSIARGEGQSGTMMLFDLARLLMGAGG